MNVGQLILQNNIVANGSVFITFRFEMACQILKANFHNLDLMRQLKIERYSFLMQFNLYS